LDDREETEQADKQVTVEFYECSPSMRFVSRDRIIFRLPGHTSILFYLLLALNVPQEVPMVKSTLHSNSSDVSSSLSTDC
jgi:hypothetical protein